jgi:hypothetical protein
MRTQMLTRALVLLGLLVSTLPVAAQQAETSGGLTPGWSVTPAVSAGAVYDSNVGLANAPASTGETQSDRLLLVQPSAELQFVSQRTQFSGGYNGSLRRYVEFDPLNSFSQSAYLSLRRLATKHVTWSLSENYSEAPSTDELELNGVPYVRTGSKRNVVAGRVEARLSKFTDIGFSVDQNRVSFERPGVRLNGGVVTGGHFDLSRRIQQRLSVGGEYAVRFATFDEGTREVMFHDAGGTVRYRILQRTSVGGAAGIAYLDDRSLGETRRGPYVRADVTQTTEHATFGGSFDRTFVPSFGFGGSSRSEEVRGFVRMPIPQNRMYVQSSASWRKTEPFVTGGLSLETTAVRSTFGYAVARYVRLELFHILTHQDNGIPGGNINRQRIGTQVVISQPMRIQ